MRGGEAGTSRRDEWWADEGGLEGGKGRYIKWSQRASPSATTSRNIAPKTIITTAIIRVDFSYYLA